MASISGGIAYDKYEQKKAREHWVNKVEPIGKQPYGSLLIPGRLTIFIAPPPNDFLDESLRVFRRFVKPVLNSAAIDFQIFTETRQGDIRMAVANRIRELRQQKLDQQRIDQQQQQRNSLAERLLPWAWGWGKSLMNWVSRLKPVSKPHPDPMAPEELKSVNELYEPKDVLGLYSLLPVIEPKCEDEIDPKNGGGVLCIGRGAYKEYMAGVHEGLLGPLEKPQRLIDAETQIAAEKAAAKKEAEDQGNTYIDDDDDEPEEGAKKRKPVVAPYITPDEYDEAHLPKELDMLSIVLDKENRPALFEQPVYVFPVPNLLGFLNTPEKIYRYFTKRRLADDYGRRAAAIVDAHTRPYEYKDTLMAKEEELDWPKKWVQTGHDKNAEWVQDVIIDERVQQRMRVFKDDKK